MARVRQLTPMTRGRTDVSSRTRSDLVDALATAARGPNAPDPGDGSVRDVAFLRPPAVRDHLGCVACAAADTEMRRWFFFFETETNHDEEVRTRIRESGGLCPPHTRRLLDSTPAAAWLARGVFDDLLRGLSLAGPHRAARRRPGAGLLRRGSAARVGCPVCTAVDDRVADTLAVLDRSLAASTRAAAGGSDVAAAYRSGQGLCVGHARRLLTTASATASVAVIADGLARSLAVGPENAVAVLTGGDDDAPARARIRERRSAVVLAGAAAARQESFAARVRHLTAQPCCPTCAARDRASWRLLDWLGGRLVDGRRHDEPDAHLMREQLAGICGTHLSDLVRGDGGGAWLSGPVATVVRLAAHRWRDAALDLGAAAAGSVGVRALTVLAAQSGPRMSCLVCAYSSQAAAREFDLLRLVGADHRFAAAVRDAHGVCARCLPHLDPARGGPWAATFAGGARQLAFELESAIMADSWTARWDISGSERSSWQRAPFLLDGAILGPRAATG